MVIFELIGESHGDDMVIIEMLMSYIEYAKSSDRKYIIIL
jgi:hypothetical protein